MAIKVIGQRVLVEDIKTAMDLVERAQKAGLYIVTDERQEPQVTMGRVVALGNDPLIAESGIVLDSIVTFSRHAGVHQYFEGIEGIRSLELQEIIFVLDPSDAAKITTQKAIPSSTDRIPGLTDTGQVYGPGSSTTVEAEYLPRDVDPQKLN